ncbi:uncharacterized protein LOC124419353 [Lucilia cuprina]|uniref:uncharacterized protein LOC124419353 n=1 Tax=Lucilia cuprina TaxID=7375 RepID=UPI001F061E0F|nr:uncharacterized protein LOC124419353 [Lucilia cuprina]
MKKSKGKRPKFNPLEPTEKQKARKLAQEARKIAWKRKRRLEEKSRQLVIIPPRDLTEKQRAWIQKNCQPKFRQYPRPLPSFSRWAKRGPMTRSDWVKFYKWADLKAEAKQLPKPPEEPKKKRKKRFKITLEDLLEDIEKLSAPKMPREKYQFPQPINYPYAPKIHWNEPAKRDPGRPFPTPKVPFDFQHIELEIDFWSKLRFPVRPEALRYTPSKNILNLSQPRITPPLEPHCPIPPKPLEYVEPRKRMTRSQWKEHQKRLAYLAMPVYHPTKDIYY